MKNENQAEISMLSACVLTFIASALSMAACVMVGVNALTLIPPVIILASCAWWAALQQVRRFIASI